MSAERCMAIVKGRRCARRYRWTSPITFTWDPVKGEGIDGPSVRLCRQHGHAIFAKDRAQRLRVVGGWYGAAWNDRARVWTVLHTVYASSTGLRVSPLWYRFARPYRSGDTQRRTTYDEARKEQAR